MDLTSYGISTDVAFNKEDSGSGQNILTTKSILKGFRGLEGLRLNFVLHIYSEMAGSHRPYYCATFNQLSIELETNDCVLRKVTKKLSSQGYLIYSKLKGSDAPEPDTYIFGMGPRFGEKHIWKSKLFIKKIGDHITQLIRPKVLETKIQTVHDGLPLESKQSMMDSQTVHDGPPSIPENIDTKEERTEKPAPVFSLSSKKENISLSSGELEESFTQLSIGIGIQKTQIQDPTPSDIEERKRFLRHQAEMINNNIENRMVKTK